MVVIQRAKEEVQSERENEETGRTRQEGRGAGVGEIRSAPFLRPGFFFFFGRDKAFILIAQEPRNNTERLLFFHEDVDVERKIRV